MLTAIAMALATDLPDGFTVRHYEGEKMTSRIRTSSARRLWALPVLVVAALILSSCGAPAQPTEPPQPVATAQPAPTEKPTQAAAAPTLTPAPEGPVKGGSLVMAWSDEPASMDAAIGSSSQEWLILFMLYRGLMIYDGDKTVPDMAEKYEISPDGTVYTFTLKSGVKFSNGREVVAEDYKYSLQRTMDPDLASWGSYYLVSLVGAQDVLDGKTKDCTGIEVLDKYTLRFTLTAPDMTFLNILALQQNWPVPKEEVEKWGADFGAHPTGAGPFMVKEFIPGEKAVFVPNPYYYVEGQPYLDEVTYLFNIDMATALMRTEKGEVDVLCGETIPPSEYSRVVTDPNLADWVKQEPAMYTTWLGLNNQRAPLNEVKVRQAINMAVNRDKLVKMQGGKSEALYAIYPSAAPGFDPNYKPYPYDPAAAKALLAEAGHADGLELELVIGEEDATQAQAVQQDLAEIGIKVNIKPLGQGVRNELIDSGGTDMWFTGWYMIQPDVADLINNLYMTGAGSNSDKYSNPRVDELAMQALADQDRDRRLKTYQEIEHLLMDDAVHVPLYNSMSMYLCNPRVEGFYSRSEYGVYFEQMWIKQ